MEPPLLDNALAILKKFWGHDRFRDGQETAVLSVLEGKDTLIILPTGGGKSVCYQVPALLREGLTLVVSPLIALMEDQVKQLSGKGIRAAAINSMQSVREVEQHLINARNGMYDLLYCSPERLESSVFQHELSGLSLSLIAIDEAHCISEWGHQFRPAYRRIREALTDLDSSIPWMALTATATPEVRKDILEMLALRNPVVVAGGFDRPNLQWWVVETERKQEKLLEMVERASRNKDSGLIYTDTRRSSEDLARLLRDHGYQARSYHAGLPVTRRHDIQKAWLDDRLPWIVSTNAFGMGIDKDDCRYVFHYTMPASLEAYYQEAGRAGRSGKPAFPILLYQDPDFHRLQNIIKQNYPDKHRLNHLYATLCDSLEVPVGSNMEKAKPVGMAGLIQRSNLSEKEILAGLRLLNQLGLIELITDYQPELGVQFIIGQDAIIDFAATTLNRPKGDFVDRLYRLYGPESLHEYRFLKLEYLLDKLEISRNKLIKGIGVLQQEQILIFEEHNNAPLIALPEARYGSLPYSTGELESYRNILLEKLRFMQGYIHTKGCRSRYIRTYFGEENVPDFCGKCDNCRRRLQDQSIPEVKPQNIRLCYHLLKEKPRTARHLARDSGYSPKMIRHILEILLREELITDSPESPGLFSVHH